MTTLFNQCFAEEHYAFTYSLCPLPLALPRFMIACDRCDQWFHGECIGISEKQGEFNDSYYCDVCGKETGKYTSWESKCGNSACSKAARISSHQGHLSKYCSHDCDMQVARARLELTEMKERAATIEATSSIPHITIDNQRHSQLTSHAQKGGSASPGATLQAETASFGNGAHDCTNSGFLNRLQGTWVIHVGLIRAWYGTTHSESRYQALLPWERGLFWKMTTTTTTNRNRTGNVNTRKKTADNINSGPGFWF